MFEALAKLAHRGPKRVVAAAILLAVVAGVLGGGVADRLDPYGADDESTEAVQSRERLEAGGVNSGVEVIALVDAGGPVRAAAGGERVDRVARILRSDRDVGRVVTFRDAGPALVSRDGTKSYVAASFRSRIDDTRQADVAERLEKRFEGVPGVKLGGAAIAQPQVNEQVSEDLARAEMLAFPLLFLLSLLFFRSLVAALLPLLVGGLSIVLTFLGLRIAGDLTSVSVFALNLVTGLGLGLAIDYSLFVVSRYREELVKSGPGLEALRRTLATAGRTVLFSSLTVAAAMAALLVFPQRFLYSMGIGGVMVALIGCVVALVVLPSVLALLGERVNALAPKRLRASAYRDASGVREGFWYRLSQAVMRRPARIAIASAAVLIALGIPFLGIQFTSVDPSVLPETASARQVDDTLDREFPPAQTAPITLAVESPPDRRVAELRSELRRLDGVDSVSPPRPITRELTEIDVTARGRFLSEESQDLVREIRDHPAPVPVAVGGSTAEFLDLQQSLVDHMPLAFGIIAVTTLLVLFLMTGSVVLPLKALVMNLLTLSAAFGILVLIFQDGRLEGFLDYRSQGALETTQPVVLFALAFGLSTDYNVFLLSRIKEARDGGLPDGEAVAVGLERTGRIVTAAALLFCVAVGSFATSEMIFIKEVGLGTALAVLIDATIVRALLVPSLMELLGRWNWWSPRPLRRLYERFGLREAATS